jgi:2-C-methyl-D-erythritol 4-phosphate cytidylyltransferase
MSIALILAAGRGERLGAGAPKALIELAGRPLVQWSIDAMGEVRGIEEIVLALPRGTPPPRGVTAVQGGAARSESVRRALDAAGPGDPVIVHDAARPLVTRALVEAVLAALAADVGAQGAIAAIPVTDTVKRVCDGAVSGTLERSSLWAVQTPQVFRRAALERALDVPDEVLAEATDDAWLIERQAGRVIVVRSTEENLKVTGSLDLQVAGALLALRAEPSKAGPA